MRRLAAAVLRFGADYTLRVLLVFVVCVSGLLALVMTATAAVMSYAAAYAAVLWATAVDGDWVAAVVWACSVPVLKVSALVAAAWCLYPSSPPRDA